MLAISAPLAGCQGSAAYRSRLTHARPTVPMDDVEARSPTALTARRETPDDPRPGSDPTEDRVQQVSAEGVDSQIPATTLDHAIAISLSRNPGLLVLRAGEPVAHAAYHVAETYPFNPFVQVQVLPYAHDKGGNTLDVNHYVWLMQTLELAHQMSFREASASAALNQVRWNIVQAELTQASLTERLYFTALYQRDLAELADRAHSINAELQGIVSRRFNAGLATPAEVTTARVALRQSQRQAELVHANYQTAILALRRQLNLSPGEKMVLSGRLEQFLWRPVFDDQAVSPESELDESVLGARAAELAHSRPDIMAAQCGVGVARANAGLAQANQRQNIAIGPIYERDESGTVFAGFRTQLNLPVWDTGAPLTAQRQAECNLQRVTFQQLCSRARVEAQTAVERYERARRIVAQEQGVPHSTTEELDALQDQFASGQADILNVFAAQNSLLQERRAYLDVLNEVAQSAADVTLMTGIPPARLVNAVLPIAPDAPESPAL